MIIETRTDAIDAVLDGLKFLILTHATTCAREQYAPSKHVDASDDEIRDNKEYVAKLRSLREHFENIVTGII